MKRRFVKNYAVVRNLTCNPRTPLDVSLSLIKHLLITDLRHVSGNKEVSETVRKLALKMFKQKLESGSKRSCAPELAAGTGFPPHHPATISGWLQFLTLT